MSKNLDGGDVSRDAMRDALTSNGLTPHFEYIRANTLKSPEYQRPLRPGWAKTIARNLDPDKFWPLIVSRRADGDYVLDGQHRLVAVRDVLNWQDQNVPCDVYTGLTVVLEAKLFATQAGRSRKHISALEELHADLIQGIPDAVGVDLTVRRARLRLADDNSTEAPGNLRAAKALRSMYRTHGPARLLEVLALLRDTYGTEPRFFQTEVLRGTGAFLSRYADDPHYDRAEFVRKIGLVGFDAMMQRGRAIQVGLGHATRGGGAHIGRTFFVLYNYKKTTLALPEWQDRIPLSDDAARSRNDQISETARRQFAQGTRPPPTGIGAAKRPEHAAD